MNNCGRSVQICANPETQVHAAFRRHVPGGLTPGPLNPYTARAWMPPALH